MSSNTLFISYGHRDMTPINWLDRLKLYLAPLRRQELVDIWDDTRLEVGRDWRSEIKANMERASSAILLVGPGFMASEFIAGQELPVLLAAATTRGARIYPLVVGYCGYKRSILERYQAFNDPEMPLEALTTAEQNKILNQLSLIVDQDIRHSHSSEKTRLDSTTDIYLAMKEIDEHLKNTRIAFEAQCRRRNDLIQMMIKRLNIKEMLEYENFFFRYYGKLNEEERFQFEQMRAMTEGPIYGDNQAILKIIEQHQEVIDEVPELADLKQHLVFWLNKYDKVFSKRPEMCLLYTGVEDGVPFPTGLDYKVKQWLKIHKRNNA